MLALRREGEESDKNFCLKVLNEGTEREITIWVKINSREEIINFKRPILISCIFCISVDRWC